jgi:adenine-specific DNA-methyltransferase
MQKLDGKTFNVVQDNIEKLKQLFPEVFTENKIDFEKLMLTLGEHVEKEKERYEFTWNGKTKAIQLAQKQTTGTLRPCKEESVNWDTTKNLYIEGDNLEVLRVLQNSYRNKVKMIYIDPPYNTGKDFVYKDDFHDNIKNYKEKNEENMKSNPETNGRYHTDWLNMMYPRLKISRNLLLPNGIIFISISDKEYANLKKVCDEIFGEENFLATLIWDRNHSAQAGIFKVYHEYILVYAKDSSKITVPKSLNNEYFEAGAMKKQSSRHPMKDFTFPKGTRFDAPDGTELKGEWGGVEKVILKNGRMISENGKLKEDVTLCAAYTQYEQMKEYFYGNKESLRDSRGQKIVEFYFNSSGKIKIVKERGVETPQTTQKFGTQSSASVDLASLFNLNDSPIDSPKPIKMIKDFLGWFTEDGDIILDFFSGSATTAHAILEINAERNEKRHFILVQIKELLKENSEAFKVGYQNICEIGKERIRRAGQKIVEENKDKEGIENLDIGFKVFKLDDTNLKVWDEDSADLERDLLDLINPIKEGRTQEDVVYEILLKYGVDLTVPIEETKVVDKVVYSVGMGYLLICLERDLTLEHIEEIAKKKPARVVFYDEGFKDDTVRINAQQILKRYGVEDIRVI